MIPPLALVVSDLLFSRSMVAVIPYAVIKINLEPSEVVIAAWFPLPGINGTLCPLYIYHSFISNKIVSISSNIDRLVVF